MKGILKATNKRWVGHRGKHDLSYTFNVLVEWECLESGGVKVHVYETDETFIGAIGEVLTQVEKRVCDLEALYHGEPDIDVEKVFTHAWKGEKRTVTTTQVGKPSIVEETNP